MCACVRACESCSLNVLTAASVLSEHNYKVTVVAKIEVMPGTTLILAVSCLLTQPHYKL